MVTERYIFEYKKLRNSKISNTRRPVTMLARTQALMLMDEEEWLAYYTITAITLALQEEKQFRSCWVRKWIEKRDEKGHYRNLLQELREENPNDPKDFINFLRMTPQMYDEILARVGPRLEKQRTRCREPIEPGLKLALTLRHLASGDTYTSLHYDWRVPVNTQSIFVPEVCQALIDEYGDELLSPPVTPEAWKEISDEFYAKWNFPHVVGAIDGKHIAIRAPGATGSSYRNYKGFFSVVMLAVVDANYKFLWVDLGARGMASDGQIFNASELKECIDDGSIAFPPAEPLPYDNVDDVPYFLVGDDAFALRTTLMKPFPRRGLSLEEAIFNYRLSRVRRVSENAFGILANRFQILLSTMRHKPENVRTLVTACILLHNLMRTRYPSLGNNLVDYEDANHQIIPGEWRRGRNLTDLKRCRGNRLTLAGQSQRLLLKHYINSPVGSVPWQRQMVVL